MPRVSDELVEVPNFAIVNLLSNMRVLSHSRSFCSLSFSPNIHIFFILGKFGGVMYKKCDKCKDYIVNGSTYIEGGISYHFCKTCTNILETFPVPTNIMHIFLTPEDRLTQFQRNIFEARKRRVSGNSPWNSEIKCDTLHKIKYRDIDPSLHVPMFPKIEIIELLGCDSLHTFFKHLIRSNCKDFDFSEIEKKFSSCTKCNSQKDEEKNNFLEKPSDDELKEIEEFEKQTISLIAQLEKCKVNLALHLN